MKNWIKNPACAGVRRPHAGDAPGPGDHPHQDQGSGGHWGDARPHGPHLQASQAKDRHYNHVHW